MTYCQYFQSAVQSLAYWFWPDTIKMFKSFFSLNRNITNFLVSYPSKICLERSKFSPTSQMNMVNWVISPSILSCCKRFTYECSFLFEEHNFPQLYWGIIRIKKLHVINIYNLARFLYTGIWPSPQYPSPLKVSMCPFVVAFNNCNF